MLKGYEANSRFHTARKSTEASPFLHSQSDFTTSRALHKTRAIQHMKSCIKSGFVGEQELSKPSIHQIKQRDKEMTQSRSLFNLLRQASVDHHA